MRNYLSYTSKPYKYKLGDKVGEWWRPYGKTYEEALQNYQILRMNLITSESDLGEEEDLSALANQEDLVKKEMQNQGISKGELLKRKLDLIERGVMTPTKTASSEPLKPETDTVDPLKVATGMQVAAQAANLVDKAVMGNKNFGAQSAAVDTAIHGTSSALMKSGNPYAMAAGAALEVANFATKATGDSVAGFDVNIDSSGYGNMGHKEAKANRDWGAAIGLGGLFNRGKMEAQLALRNREMLMALKAANIAEDVKFEQEARANSVEEVIQQNQIALDGGIDTSLLAARKGAKLMRLEEYRKRPKKAKAGAKLEQVELSDGGNIVPTGELHKNKHDLDLEHITPKGVPVITVNDDSATTFEEIKAQEDSITEHCEIEAGEIILNKSLTDYVEEKRKAWHAASENDPEILLEVGKRLTKEILYNTADEGLVINSLKDKV